MELPTAFSIPWDPSIRPMKLDRPPKMAKKLRLMIFPMAIAARLMGVTSRVARVPRSFSPAMDSGATAAQLENSSMTIMAGMKESIKDEPEERSGFSTFRFTSKMFTMEVSYYSVAFKNISYAV